MSEDTSEGFADQPTEEEAVRRLFVRLIEFVALARATDRAKDDALDAIEKLQARL